MKIWVVEYRYVMATEWRASRLIAGWYETREKARAASKELAKVYGRYHQLRVRAYQRIEGSK